MTDLKDAYIAQAAAVAEHVNTIIELRDHIQRIKEEAFIAGWNRRTAATGRWITYDKCPDLDAALARYMSEQ